jgi:type IV pilus assembly protein PilN
MIKINLLPQKARAKKGAEQSPVWLFVLLGAFLLEVAGLFVLHGIKEQELQAQTRKNAEVQAQITQVKAQVADHKQVQDKLKTLRDKEEAIRELQSARTGPTVMLLELARILTPGRGPSVKPEELNRLRRENPLSIYNPGWDGRRAWLTELTEDERRVKLKGLARDGEDVSELARRLSLSSYFTDVRLLPGRKVDSKGGPQLIEFNLEARVRY